MKITYFWWQDRLGAGTDGLDALKRHPFLAGLCQDKDELWLKEPPFVPGETFLSTEVAKDASSRIS